MRADGRKPGAPGSQRSGNADIKYAPAAVEIADKILPKIKLRSVLLREMHGDRRVRSFRGRDLVEALRANNVEYEGRKAESEEHALALAERLLNSIPSPKVPRLFWPCEPLTKDDKKEKKGKLNVVMPVQKPTLRADQTIRFDKDARYFCVYEPSNRMQYLYIGIIVAIVILLCLFPIWPIWVRTIIWYISVTFLLATLGLMLVQLLAFGISWLLGYELWILPGTWTSDSWSSIFSPLYTIEKSGETRPWVRPLVLAILVALAAYLYYQTPDVNAFLEQQKQFVDDLYAGTLLGDGSEAASGAQATGGRSSFGFGNKRRGPHIPDISEIEKMVGEDFSGPTMTPTPEATPDMDAMLHEDRDL